MTFYTAKRLVVAVMCTGLFLWSAADTYMLLTLVRGACQ